MVKRGVRARTARSDSNFFLTVGAIEALGDKWRIGPGDETPMDHVPRTSDTLSATDTPSQSSSDLSETGDDGDYD